MMSYTRQALKASWFPEVVPSPMTISIIRLSGERVESNVKESTLIFDSEFFAYNQRQKILLEIYGA